MHIPYLFLFWDVENALVAWLNILLCWPVEMNNINIRIIYDSYILYIQNLIRLTIEIPALAFLIFNNLYTTSNEESVNYTLLQVSAFTTFCFIFQNHKLSFYVLNNPFNIQPKIKSLRHCILLSWHEKYPGDIMLKNFVKSPKNF